jgi:hypothetical protein
MEIAIAKKGDIIEFPNGNKAKIVEILIAPRNIKKGEGIAILKVADGLTLLCTKELVRKK